MRENKFCGKRIDTGEWVYGDLVTCSKKHAYIVTYFEKGEFLSEEALTACKCVVYKVKAETVGQYTGLKDKNGKEIYEGDVLRYTKVGGHSSRGIVKYVTEFARWEYWHTQQKQGFPVLSDHDNMEVIGTIHDQKAEV